MTPKTFDIKTARNHPLDSLFSLRRKLMKGMLQEHLINSTATVHRQAKDLSKANEKLSEEMQQRSAVEEKLEQSEFTFRTLGEAIDLAKTHADKIHLLMTDVVMPEMNGRDLAGQLIRLYPEIKRLFMSGYTANVIAHHGVLDDGVAFIQKPFSMAEMTMKVREVLDKEWDSQS
jgi:response regulator RpfG family c-di-GMP phosphodiesterase